MLVVTLGFTDYWMNGGGDGDGRRGYMGGITEEKAGIVMLSK